MELFERIYLLKGIAGSLQAVADALGIAPQKISAYSNFKSQKNFYPHLPQLLAVMPQVRRDWLYFEEGPMLEDPSNPLPGGDSAALEVKLQKLSESFAQVTDANQKLLEQNQKLIEQNHSLVEQLLKQNLKGE